MEVGLQIQRPASCRPLFEERGRLKIKSFTGFSHRSKACSFSSLASGGSHNPANGIFHKITASADFSRKGRMSSSGPKSSTPRGFMPKTPLGNAQKRRQKKMGEQDGNDTATVPNEFPDISNKLPGAKVNFEQPGSVLSGEGILEKEMDNESKTVEEEEEAEEEELPSTIEESDSNEIHMMLENGSIDKEAGVSALLQEKETVSGSSARNMTDGSAIESLEIDLENESDPLVDKTPEDDESLKFMLETDAVSGSSARSMTDGSVIESFEIDFEDESDPLCDKTPEDDKSLKLILEKETVSKSTARNMRDGSAIKSLEIDFESESDPWDDKTTEDEESLKLMLKKERENQRREEIEVLAEENLARGIRMFVYPTIAKPDEDIEVFLNRNLSTLINEPDVLIMGAFNDWKWKSFTRRLEKTQLNGGWWSCLLHIPKEAYKVDFVFFNGQSVYDNNDEKDFSVAVEGGMDVLEFENFLQEEKRREQEKLAKEKAEKERQEEEKRRIEAEKAAAKADKAQAKVDAQKKQEMLKQAIQRAEISLENVWYIEPSDFKGENKVKLYYNKSSGPLVDAKEIWLHGGYDNWVDGLSIVAKLVDAELESDAQIGDWWYTEVVVPDRALVIDWVFADGPPEGAVLYDNNNRQDFHAVVHRKPPEELYWLEEENLIFKKLQEERRLREEALRAKVEKTACLKAETKEKTLRKFLLSKRHVVYTEPLDVQAGSSVTVYYNPSNTVLNGKPEIWFRGSFNRWTHRMGPLPPQKMVPSESGSHVKATVRVPLDAYMMDFVFSEREDGGIFDNNHGMDYHLPVVGGIVKEPPMNIVHIAVEMAPIAKVGGLGDVVTSLSRAVQELNHNVDIILPKYDCLKHNHVKDLEFNRSYHWGGTEIKVWHGKVEGLSVYFLEPQNGLFGRGCVYGCSDDAGRFGFFCHAALEFLLQGGFHPDIIHCHDWSSAPVAWLFKDQYMHYGLSKARVIFTIHNLEFGAHFIGKAMEYADKATTVSHTYSKEVSGNSLIAPHLYKFHGIINGIDPDIWDPYNDDFIAVPYTSENVVEGKRAAKEALQNRLGLKRADLPLVGIITRLTHQKGIHLIKHAIGRTLERNGQVVLLGSAPDPRIQQDFQNLADRLHHTHCGQARLLLVYDEPLSHMIYAGADFILVPSIFEPCGLTQLTAMRYGAIPVVRKTGGLYDTVFDVDHDKDRAEALGLEPNGFSFDGADAAGVDYALNRAISAWYDGREWFQSLCKSVMEQDWSWNRPALEYLELYHSARK